MTQVELTKEEVKSECESACSVFQECGGCSYQDIPYSLELKIKEGNLKALLCGELSLDEKLIQPIMASPQQLAYRQRIDLRLQRTKNGILIGYTPESKRGILPIEKCPIALEAINKSIPRIKKEAVEKLPDKYRQANLTIKSADDGRVFWGGIGRRSLKMNEKDYLWTEVNGKKIFFAMETFFQANLSILTKLIGKIRSLEIIHPQTHLLDLYGGVGLFSISLYDDVKRVTLIEEVAASVACAKFNKSYHRCGNLEIIEGRVEENFEKILADNRENSVAIVDPPRAGLSDEARRFLAKSSVSQMIYLSCHPAALCRDLSVFMSNGWNIKEITPFDFFPKTKHIETLVLMENQDGAK